MPIRPELRQFYGRQWRTEIRPRILQRAGDKCEQCGKPDRVEAWTRTLPHGPAPMMFWCPFGESRWRDHHGRPVPERVVRTLFSVPIRKVRVVLTVGHLNHTPGDDRDENLKALCQWCHLNYDKLHHRETRCTRKDAGRPLLREMSA